MKPRNTDTVDAKLTPREAILNRNAAELLGRDTIKRLNDHGNMLSRRGVDLASRNLPSDPTPGPSTENLLGYAMGTADVGRDDRGDLLRDADATFYGGGQVPAPTPTPTPIQRQYGSTSTRFLSPSEVQSGNADQLASTSNIDYSQDPSGRAMLEESERRIKDAQARGLPTYRYGYETSSPIGYQYGTSSVDDPYDSLKGTVHAKRFPKTTSLAPGYGSQANTQQFIPNPSATQPAPYDPVAAARNIRMDKLTAYGSKLGAPSVQPLQQPQSSQPTLTGYHWFAGTGGVSGGNNANSYYNWSDNTSTHEPAGSQYQFPRLGLPRSEQPAIGQAPSPYTIAPENVKSYQQAGGQGNWDVSVPGQPVFRGQNLPFTADAQGVPRQWDSVPSGGDPSVGALANSSRTTNELGQQVINPAGGGQIITGMPRLPDDQITGYQRGTSNVTAVGRLSRR